MLAALCDGLPLALCIAAERAARAGSFAEVVAAMADERPAGHPAPDMSPRSPGPTGHSVPRPPPCSAGWVCTRPVRSVWTPPRRSPPPPAAMVRTTLDQLVAANLVTHHRPDRYHLSELVRLYAKEMAGTN